MKTEEHQSSQSSGVTWLIPLAWFGITVATPAAFVWFGGSDATARERVDGGASRSGVASGVEGPVEALTAYRAEQQRRLENYGWVDREAGVVRVPIEEAMQAILRAGLPAREVGEEQR
jgi:hypothetical protein